MKIIYDKSEGTIYHGHVLDVLKSLPNESVHCCVTSPPYWGLRDYGLPDQIWGGLEDCQHDWGDHLKIHKGGPPGNGVMLSGGRRVCNEHEKTKDIIAGKFCQKCGAWSGSLGHEPTPDLFIDHIVEIFTEVLRVLRPDGTVWLNFGDSYSSGGNAGHSTGRNLFYGHNKIRGDLAGQNKKPPPGLKPKELVGIPWLVAFALRAGGWYLRQDIIWHKPNPMPESVRDRCTKSHEYIFLLSKSQRYYCDMDAIKEPASPNTHARYALGRSENHKWSDGGQGNQTIAKTFKHMRNHSKKPGVNPKAAINSPGCKQNESFSSAVKDIVEDRNKRSVWTVSTKPFSGAHFATFPPDLIEPCILAGCPSGGTVLDPFFGAGTTGIVAYKNDRKFIGIELSEPYLNDIAIPRIEKETQQLKLFNVNE